MLSFFSQPLPFFGLDSQLGLLTRRLGSALRPAATHFLLGSRPQPLQRSPSAHLLSGCSTLLESTIYDEILPDDDSSDLTHGNETPGAFLAHFLSSSLSLTEHVEASKNGIDKNAWMICVFMCLW